MSGQIPSVLLISSVIFVLSRKVACDFECPAPDGLFDGTKCGEYFQCKKGTAVLKSCPAGEGFRAEWQRCTWEGLVPNCGKESGHTTCGILKDDDNGSKDPWAVAVNYKSSEASSWDYVGPGTIISPTKIITSCKFQRKDGRTIENLNAASFHVVAGFDQINLDSMVGSSNAQDSAVKSIKINPHRDAKTGHFCNVIMVLATPLDLTATGVAAACMPVFRQEPPSRAIFRNGKVAITGFKVDSRTLSKSTAVGPVGKMFHCRRNGSKLLCAQKIEISDSSMSDICAQKSITAVIFEPLKQRWFAYGIGSTLENSFCYLDQINDEVSLRWAIDVFRCGDDRYSCSSDGKCIDLKETCDGKSDCTSGEDENPFMCQGSAPSEQLSMSESDCGSDQFQCDDGTCIKRSQVCDGNLDCSNSEDEAGCDKKSKETMTTPPIDTTTIEPTRSAESSMATEQGSCNVPEPMDGAVISCGGSTSGPFDRCPSSVRAGVIAKYECAPKLFKSIGGSVLFKKCMMSSEWKASRAELFCEPECGIIDTSVALMLGARKTDPRRFPWHVAIFMKGKDGSFEYGCGGTLIHKNFILTAAHCIPSLDPSAYKIVLAPASSNLVRAQQTQIHAVKSVLPNENYMAGDMYPDDIALMELAEPARISTSVTIACLPSDDEYPETNDVGEVPGFGVDESGKASDVLKYISVPVRSKQDCKNKMFMTPSTSQFCGGFTNGSGICNGDSGGGTVFPMFRDGATRYYVKGIVSMGAKNTGADSDKYLCNYRTYSIFTSVASYVRIWVKKKVQQLTATADANFQFVF